MRCHVKTCIGVCGTGWILDRVGWKRRALDTPKQWPEKLLALDMYVYVQYEPDQKAVRIRRQPSLRVLITPSAIGRLVDVRHVVSRTRSQKARLIRRDLRSGPRDRIIAVVALKQSLIWHGTQKG